MNRKYIPILLLTFVNIIGFTILIPVLPNIVKQFVSEDTYPLVYGLLLSTYAFCQFLAAPVLGTLSDKFGRRPLLIVSQLGTTFSWVIFGFSYFIGKDAMIVGIPLALLIIFISRITDGITGGNISVANAWISDVTKPEDKGSVFAILGAIFGLGFIIGPVIGGIAAGTTLGYLGTAISAFLISLVTLFFVIFVLPESLDEDKREKELEFKFFKEINIFRQVLNFRGNRIVTNTLIIKFFYSLVFAAYTTVIILIMQDLYHLNEVALGFILSTIGIFSFINQGLIARKFIKKYGDLNSLKTSVAILFIGLMVVSLIPTDINIGNFSVSLLLVMINAYVINIGLAIGNPAFKSILTNNVDEKKQGKITGIDESLAALGNSLTPVMAGFIYAVVGSLTFGVYALLLVIPIAFIYLRYGNLSFE